MLHPEIARVLVEDRIQELHRAADAARLAARARHGAADGEARPIARPRARVSAARLRLLGTRLLTSLR